MRARRKQNRQAAGNQQDANLRWPKETVRQPEIGKRICSEICLDGEYKKGHQHSDRDLPVNVARCGQSAHQSGGSKRIDHMIDVESAAASKASSMSRQCSI